jgi:hypothetical protein
MLVSPLSVAETRQPHAMLIRSSVQAFQQRIDGQFVVESIRDRCATNNAAPDNNNTVEFFITRSLGIFTGILAR